MKTKKGGRASFDADTFVQLLAKLVECLPAADEQQKNAAALDDIIRFLMDMRERIAKIPTQEDGRSVRLALNELSALFAKAQSNPVVAAAVGLRAPRLRSVTPVPSTEDIEDAKRTIAQFEQLPIDQLRLALEGKSAGQLKALAAQLGVRSSQRISREALDRDEDNEHPRIPQLEKRGRLNCRARAHLLRQGLSPQAETERLGDGNHPLFAPI